MSEQRHTARCMCGAIILEATGKPEYVEYCHCKTCQQSSGSSYIPWIIFKKEKVRIISGKLNIYKSSEELQRGNCGNCGSTMTIHSAKNFDIALGVMDSPDAFDIDQHIWTARALKHVYLDDDLPKYDKNAPN